MFHAVGDGRSIHDRQAAVENVDIGQLIKLNCFGMGLRVGIVNAIDLGRFDDHIRVDFGSAQRGGGIR